MHQGVFVATITCFLINTLFPASLTLDSITPPLSLSFLRPPFLPPSLSVLRAYLDLDISFSGELADQYMQKTIVAVVSAANSLKNLFLVGSLFDSLKVRLPRCWISSIFV